MDREASPSIASSDLAQRKPMYACLLICILLQGALGAELVMRSAILAARSPIFLDPYFPSTTPGRGDGGGAACAAQALHAVGHRGEGGAAAQAAVEPSTLTPAVVSAQRVRQHHMSTHAKI